MTHFRRSLFGETTGRQRAQFHIAVLVSLLLMTACGGGGGLPPDTMAPVIEVVAPAAGSEITDVVQTLTWRISDAGGLDAASLQVTANGADRTADSVLTDRVLTLTPTPASRWERGPLDIHIAIKDKAGNSGSGDFSYTVTPGLQAFPRAVPKSGPAPLNVTFYPDTSVDAVVESYSWDFDNDGTADVTDAIGRAQTRAFKEPGIYTITLVVTDNAGAQSSGSVTVTVDNAPPEVTAEATPSNGAIPLRVNFTAQASDNEGIATYSWDFDGDGTAETSGATNASASHTYDEPGIYKPILAVTDTLGASTKLQVPSIEVRAGPAGSPSISAGANPITGKAPLAVSFTATVTDPEGRPASKWWWDFDGNGTYDAESTTTGYASYTYTAPGEYYARVKVTMADGGSAEDVIRIHALQDITLSLSTDTVNIDAGESSTITTTLGGSSKVSLVIENAAGKIVRTLVDGVQRAGGTYEDIWDGKDDHGKLVPEGQYRVILLHEENGESKRFDLGLTTGGQQSNPGATYNNRFAPFAADPLEITYSLDRASEVTAFMGYLGAGTRRLFTFYHRKPLGRGTHTILWNGENEDGVMIEPPQGSRGFLAGFFAYTLPDNAIIVQNSVEIDTLASAPPVLVPDAVAPDGSSKRATLSFNLSRAARIAHTVNNAETGEIVYRKVYNAIEAGSAQVHWDGKTSQGAPVAPGYYRHGISAVDAQGNKSITLYAMQRVYY
ncbi:MAG TPA: PKD domain-containing protein [Gammaproteobacteria bacterium]|nr:PKD domain-containing protein [Gammaproteobacteria bacterium]